MASDNEASCASDPNFAVICSFLDCFGKSCGIEYPHIALLQEMLENAQEVPQQLIDLHVKLLRKTRKTVTVEKWERALVKFCHTYSNQDGWELERFGYKKARVAVKLRLLKVLLEAQFDSNQRFKNEVNKLAANELRVEPLGRDKIGLVYWCQLDEDCNIRVYREDLDEESWELVAKDRDGVVSLISTLSNGEAGDVVFNEEDSNSLEISEKPIIDTGQVTTSPSLDNEQKEDVESEIKIAEEQNEQNENEISKRTELVESELHGSEKNEDHMVEKQLNFVNEESHKKINESNDEESQNDDLEEEEDGEEDVGEYDITNEDNSQEDTENDDVHVPKVVTPLVFLDKNCPTERISARTLNVLNSVSNDIPNFIEQREQTSVNLDTVNMSYKNLEIKHTETPVLKISPIKSTNINDSTKLSEDRTLELSELKVPIGITLTPVIKPATSDEAVDSSTSFGKVGNRTNTHYTPADSKLIQNKISVKPMDKLSVNFNKQSEKSGGPKSLEKIAENLARNSGGVAMNVHGLLEQSSVTLGHKGMDLSTFPRGWETTNDSNRQLPFSGINLSNRKSLKPELTTPGNMMQDVQQREMDLSTRKSGKSDISNSSYDARIPLRNHPMITDISKRSIIPQVGFLNYEFSPSYHGSRIPPPIDDRRMANYGIHPDQSKMNAMHMGSIGGISTKRTLEADDVPRDILKRIRADVIPIASTMDKRQIMSNNWKDEVDEAIEEPIMIVQGEGSGSDCDIGNPGIGEPISEPVMYFSGEGDGQQCETGNPTDESSVDKNSEESKKDDRILSIDTQYIHETKATKPPVINDITLSRYESNDIPGTSTTEDRYDSPIDDSHSGSDTIKYKPTLGVQVFTKSISSSVKRTSRWDVGKPEEKSKISHEVKSMVEVANIITNKSIDAATSRLADISEISETSDITSTLNIAEKFETVENCEDLKICEIISTPAGIATSEGDASSVENTKATKIPKTTGTVESDRPSNSINTVSVYQKETCDIIITDTTASTATEITSSKTNLPIHREISPPRFFFGPNCLSYVDKRNTTDKLSAERETSMQNIESQIAEPVSTQPNIDESVESINLNIHVGDNDFVVQSCNKSPPIEIPAESTNSEQVEDVHIPTNFDNSVADAHVHVSNTANMTNSVVVKDIEGSTDLVTVAEDTEIDSIGKKNDFRSPSENPELCKTLGNLDGTESTDLLPIDDEKSAEKIQDSIVRHCIAIGDKNTKNINDITDKILDNVSDLTRLSPGSDSAVESTNIRSPDNTKHLQGVRPYLEDGNNHSSENISYNLSEKVEGSRVAADQSGTNFSPKLVSHLIADDATTSEVKKDVVELQVIRSKDKLTSINETEEFNVHGSYLIAAEPNKFSSDGDQEQNVLEQKKNVLDECDIEAEPMNQNEELLQPAVGQDVELEKPNLSELNEGDHNLPSENIDSVMHKPMVCAAVHEDQDLTNDVPSNPQKKISDQPYHDNKDKADEQIEKFEVCIKQKILGEALESDQVIEAESTDSCVKKNPPCFSQFVDEFKCKEPATDKSDEMDRSHSARRRVSLIMNDQDPKILPENVSNDKYVVYQDAVSENQSSCEDQDSNEPMVIDDRPYDSTGSSKNCELHSSIQENTEKSPLMPNNENLALSHFPQTSHNENEKPIESKKAIATIHESEAESANDPEHVIHDMNDDSETAIYGEEDNISEPKKLEQENDQVSKGDERQHDSEDQKSLVANYDSGDSCDHDTEDGFEHKSGECETKVADELFKTKWKSEGPENVDKNLSNDFQSSTSNSETLKENGQINIETTPEYSNLNRDQTHQVDSSLLESNIIHTNTETVPEQSAEDQPDTSKLSEKSNTMESTSSKMSAQLLPMVTHTIEQNLEIEGESRDEHVSESVLESKDEEVESSIQATLESGMKSLNESDIPENVNYKTLDCSTINEKISKGDLDSVDEANFYSRWLSDSQKDVCKNVESGVSENWEDRTEDKCAILETTVPSIVDTINTSNNQKCVEQNVSVHDARKKIDHELPINHTAEQLNEDSSLDEKDRTVTMSELIQDSTKKNVEWAGNDVDLSNHVVNYSISINPKSSDCSETPNKQTLLDYSFETDEPKSKTTINFLSEEKKKPETQVKIPKDPSTCVQEQDLVQATIGKDEEILHDAKKKVVEDVKKEPSKRLGDISNLDDIPPTKLKPVEVQVADSLLKPSQDNREVVIENAKKEDSNPIIKDLTSPDVKTEEFTEIQSIDVKVVTVESDDSMGDNHDLFENPQDETDPLACTEDAGTGTSLSIRVKPVSELVYEGWKLDSTEMPKVSRKRRNSIHESHSEDVLMRDEDDESEGTGGKRMRLRGKRSPDMDLRRSVEEKRQEVASSDEESSKKPKTISSKDSKPSADDNDVIIIEDEVVDKKNRGRPRGKRKAKRNARPPGRIASVQNSNTSATHDPAIISTDKLIVDKQTSLHETPTVQKKRKKRKMVLGLEVGRDIIDTMQPNADQDEMPVRQSRRIAQLKIKEEADRRRVEEETLCELKEKKDQDVNNKKKRKKQKVESEEEASSREVERELKTKKKRKKKERKKNLSKFDELNPWRSSSGTCTEDDENNDEEDEEEDEIESEGSLLFKSDHEFSPESDLEKDDESQPLRRARTAQKAQSDDDEAEDEYACQKCGKVDHPEWILLCDTCDKGWHCSCLRPALMLIPEGDWFCPPCQHNLLVTKLQNSLKTFDQYTKRHENELLRKKRLAFVGISLDNVLHKNDTHRSHRSSSQDSDNDSSSSAPSSSSSGISTSDESEPVYQLRERRCANTYKFNDYDDMINAAIQDEVEAVQGAGNQGRGKDIATIVNAGKEEAQGAVLKKTPDEVKDEDDQDKKSEKESDVDYKEENYGTRDEDDEDDYLKASVKKTFSRKKHRKLNSLDISSEDDPDSDEDFKGTSSDEEDDAEDQGSSSEDSFTASRRRGRSSGAPVRRSTRARMTRYDEDFINDDSDDSDRPKWKKSRSVWADSESEESDNSWTQRKKRSRTILTPKSRSFAKLRGKKKKKKRIIESDNHSENDEELDQSFEKNVVNPETTKPEINSKVIENISSDRATTINEDDNKIKGKTEDTSVEKLKERNLDPSIAEQQKIVKKKENTPKLKKSPPIRRKIVYGGLQDNYPKQEEETLGRRTRGRKINYQEVLASDSEEELKKALKKTEESEDEFVINDVEDPNEEAEKDSDSGDIYSPKKETTKSKGKSPKGKKPRTSKSPAAKTKATPSDGDNSKPRRKPGPKPGSKNKPRQTKASTTAIVPVTPTSAAESLISVTPKSAGEEEEATEEASLTGLGTSELAELDEEQLDQMMMEDEEYGKRQLELAAIEIAKKKKKEEREAKKMEKARLKALEILAAERQRDPHTLDGTDGEAPKKKKRGRRSKAEILAEQMRRDGAPDLFLNSVLSRTTTTSTTTVSTSSITLNVTPSLNANINANLPPFINSGVSSNVVQNLNPNLVPVSNLSTTIAQSEAQKIPESIHPVVIGSDGHPGFSRDPGMLVKPKRKGRGKGKKTLALEAARAAESAAKAASDHIVSGLGTDSNLDMKSDDVSSTIVPTTRSSTHSSAPSTSPTSVARVQLPSPGPPTNVQPGQGYSPIPAGQQSSVITRMLQSQPVTAGGPQSFTAAAAAMGHKYFGGPNTGGSIIGVPRAGFDLQPRGRIPSPYRQTSQSAIPPHFPARSAGTPSMRMRVPGPQMYHTPHHPMDPSPSGGGPISISSRDRSSPLGPGSAMIPPAAGSPLSKGGPTPPPPPPPYARGAPQMARFSDNSPMGPRHQMPPFTNASAANHTMQQPSPPPNRSSGNFSPYHPPPPNYHYGAYPPAPPPPPMTTTDDAAAYQGSPYPSEHFSTPAENPTSIQPPQPQSQPQTHPSEPAPTNKQFDEEGTGEFGGLVSYFSSQREDDLDS